MIGWPTDSQGLNSLVINDRPTSRAYYIPISINPTILDYLHYDRISSSSLLDYMYGRGQMPVHGIGCQLRRNPSRPQLRRLGCNRPQCSERRAWPQHQQHQHDPVACCDLSHLCNFLKAVRASRWPFFLACCPPKNQIFRDRIANEALQILQM